MKPHLHMPFVPEHTLDTVCCEEPLLQNTVTVMPTSVKLHEKPASLMWPSIDYLCHKFAAMTWRPTEFSTALVYRTGRIITVGVSSRIGGRIINHIYVSEIGKFRRRCLRIHNGRIDAVHYHPMSRDIHHAQPEIANTVYKVDYDRSCVFLDEIHRNFGSFVQYCPAAFPGLRIQGRHASYLVFQDGCCLILGLSDPRRLSAAHRELTGYIMWSARTKRDSDTVSRYIWDRSTDPRGRLSSFGHAAPPPPFMTGASTAGDDRFEQRLTRYFASDSAYVSTSARVEDGIVEDVRERVGLADFARCAEHLMMS